MVDADIRPQIWLYIVFLASFLAGSLCFIAHMWPPLPLPISAGLMLTRQGAAALMLSSIIIISLIAPHRPSQVLFGVILLAFAGFNLTQNLLPPVPAMYSMLLGVVVLVGLWRKAGRMLGMLVGGSSILAGTYVWVVVLLQGIPVDSGLTFGFSPVGSLFFIIQGGALLMLSYHGGRFVLTLDRSAAIQGALGVLGTFALLVIASLGASMERHENARYALEHHVDMLDRELLLYTESVERLAYRWAALGMDIPESLQQTEVQKYFRDIPALTALRVLDEDGRLLLHRGKSQGAESWLQAQLASPELASSLAGAHAWEGSYEWIMPDKSNPFLAILLVAPQGSAAGGFLAAFDVEQVFLPMLNIEGHDFVMRLEPELGSSSAAVEQGAESVPVERMTVDMRNGPSFAISATGAGFDLTGTQGVLLVAISVFGLVISYLLAVARNLVFVQHQKSRELNIKEQRFQSLFYHSPDAVFEFSTDGFYVSVNAEARTITGIGDEQLGRLHYQDVISPNAMDEHNAFIFDSAFKNTIAGSPQTFSVEFLNNDGELRSYECSFVPILVNDVVMGLYAVVKDITERLFAQENQRILQKSLESSENAVMVIDIRQESMPVVYVNSAFASMTGYSKEEVLSGSFSLIVDPMLEAHKSEQLRGAIAGRRIAGFTAKSLRRNGTAFWNQLSLTPVKDEKQAVTHYTVIMRDVSEKKEQENQLAHQATHDALTGLANRALLENRLEHDIALASRTGEHLAVLFVDLDEFKPINDSLGHRVGDEVLISVARALQRVVRPADTLARFGGDEFVLVLPGLQSEKEAVLVAERILREVSAVHRVGPHECFVSASIGIALLKSGLEQPTRILQEADMAMYKAKEQGRNTYAVSGADRAS